MMIDDGARFTASPRGQDVRRRNRMLLSSIIYFFLLFSSFVSLIGNLSQIKFVRSSWREPPQLSTTHNSQKIPFTMAMAVGNSNIICQGKRILLLAPTGYGGPSFIVRRSRFPLIRLCQRKIFPQVHNNNSSSMARSGDALPWTCFNATSTNTSSSSHLPTLLDQIRDLDKSSELASQYTPLIIFHPASSGINNGNDMPISNDSSSNVVVGHVHTPLIDSTVLHCTNDEGDPIFVMDKLQNRLGVMTDVLRLHADSQLQKRIGYTYNHDENFHMRTAAFEHVTDHLLSTRIITRKHSDEYPIYSFTEMSNIDKGADGSLHCPKGKTVLAHVNRSTAPYLGIDSVGVHLNCYVCHHDGESDSEPAIKGVWLAKRAPTKLHFPNYWDSTVAGGQPANLSLFDNIIKEAQEEAGVPEEWIRRQPPISSDTYLTDHTHDPLTITTAKRDGTCMKRSIYYSFDLKVPHSWKPTPIDGEVSEFRLYSMQELEEELRFGEGVRPSMRAVLLDFMMRHDVLRGEDNLNDLRDAMRRKRIELW